jgi:hypothetical protein
MRSPPSSEEAASVLLDLLAGRQSRQAVGAWARQWMDMPNPPFEDAPLLDAMDCLAGADRTMANGKYLFSDDDFKGWLFVMQAAQSSEGTDGH